MRNGLAAAATIGLLMLATAEGQAQQPGAGPVVQLPTFRFFTVSTTISIPDSGRGFAGGVNRSSTGSTAFSPPLGLPGNRAFGGNAQAGNVSVHAQIHDLKALDEAVLQAARDARGGKPLMIGGSPRPAADQSTAAAVPPSIQAIRARQQFEQAAAQQEVLNLIERGRQAAADGKRGLARIYYKMALKDAAGPLANDVQLALDLLDRPEIAGPVPETSLGARP